MLRSRAVARLPTMSVVLARCVAVGVAALEPPAGREARVLELERHEDPVTQLAFETPAGGALDDHAEEDVVRAGVGKTLARPSNRTFGERDAHELARPPEAPRLGQRLAHERRVACIVGQPRPVPEQFSHGDPVAAGDEAGQPALDRVTQPNATLVDELEHHDRDERLRDAAYSEAIANMERHASTKHGEAARCLAARRTVVDEHERAGASRRDDRIRRRSSRVASKGNADDDRRRRRERQGDQSDRLRADPFHSTTLT